MAKNKTIVVDQCFFGEKDRGHGLLKTTTTERDLNTFLSRISDLPISKPADVQLQPFYGCHKYDCFLIFTKTFINKLGSRPGLVFTHALIIGVKESKIVDDLGQIFDLFVDSIPGTDDFEIYQTEIELTGKPTLPNPTKPEQLFYLVNFLLTKNDGQVCVMNLDNLMPELYRSLWNTMLPELRSLLTFRLSFTYSDTHPEQYQIYFTPSTLLPKWPNETHIENYALGQPEASLSLKLLTGDRDALPLQEFMSGLNYHPVNFHGFILCEKAYTYYQQLAAINENKLLQLIRLIIKLSPNKNDGKIIKDEIFNKLKSVLKQELTASTFLLSFSNVDFSAFNDSGDTISALMQKQITAFWNNNNEEIIIDLLQRRIEEETLSWWSKSIDSVFKTALNKIDVYKTKIIWAAWTILDSTIIYFEELIATQDNIQKNLISTIPSHISETLARKITKLAARNNWFLLHANLIIKYLPPKKALETQLKLKEDDKASISIIADLFEPIEFVRTAISIDNTTIMELAVDLVISPKKVVAVADVNIIRWQYYIAQKLKVLMGKSGDLAQYKPFIWDLWDRLLTNQFVSEDLLITISNSTYNNLIDYRERAKLWDKLPKGLKNRFFMSTGKAILNKLPVHENVEPVLQEAFLNQNIVGEFMNANAKDWDKILNVFDFLPNLPQQYLSDHLNYTGQNISNTDATRLGGLVNYKNWSACANAIYEKAKIYDGYKIALSECGHLLDFWRRLKINYTYSNIPKTKAISEKEWLLNFEELCNEIYHEETEIRIIWKRAEGDVSDLKSKESARVIWHSALNNIQKGKMHGMTFRKLVSQMATENPAKRNKFNMLLNSLNELPNLN